MMDLNEKEKLVLEAVVKFYILTANPVASNYIAKNAHLAYKSATIRQVMAQLEEKGFICQPHTSAGRVPTTVGYRVYVDNMMKRARLSSDEKESIRRIINENPGDFDTVLREATRIIAHLSSQLGIIVSPQLEEGIFHRMDITRLSSDRLLLVITIKTGMVKTILLEIKSTIEDTYLDSLHSVLNERLHGMRLRDIRRKFREIVRDIKDEDTGLIHLFIETANRIFDFSGESEVFLNGTHYFLKKPDFSDNESISGVIELLEDKKVIIHLLDHSLVSEEINVKIGEEIEEQKMQNCSIIAARYKIGDVKGTLGIIGPTRMNYGHLVPLVDFTAHFLSDSFDAARAEGFD
jgi:heat-inducible transcriptional repressor